MTKPRTNTLEALRALISELQAAERAKDARRWERGATRLAAQWDAIYAAYLASTRTADGKSRVERFVATMLGQHGE